MVLFLVLIAFLFLALVLCFIMASALIGFIFTRVPFVPTAAEDIKALLKELPMGEQDVLYDLGCGDGKVLFLIEKYNKQVKLAGFEFTYWTYWLAKLKKLAKHSRVELIWGDFFKQDWSKATIIYCYLFPPLMPRVEELFLANCKPETVLVSRDFPLPKLPAFKKILLTSGHKFYFYQNTSAAIKP